MKDKEKAPLVYDNNDIRYTKEKEEMEVIL